MEEINPEICPECCKCEYLKYFVQQNVDGISTCTICQENRQTLSIPSQELKSFVRFLIRYYYSESDYNPKWGGNGFFKLLTHKNFLFHIESHKSKLENSDYAENYEDLIDNIIDPFDHDHPVELYYGYDQNGRGLFVEPHINSESALWLSLKRGLQEKNFFLLEENSIKTLKEPLKKLETTINEETEYYRSRIGYKEKEIKSSLDYIEKIKTPFSNEEIGQPPVFLSQAGRANRHGISFLYLASNEITSISEVRPDPGHYVSFGKFKCNSKLKLIDLRFIDLSKYYKNEDDFSLFKLFRGLVAELSHPVISTEKNKYLITQFLSDIIRKLGYDGLIFSSSINHGDNLVIFDPSHFYYVDNSSVLVKITKLEYDYEEVDYYYNGFIETYKEI